MIHVYLNKQHTLLPPQIEALQKQSPEYVIIPVPANGWTLQQMADEANNQRAHIGAKVCFASPDPRAPRLVVRVRPEKQPSHFRAP